MTTFRRSVGWALRPRGLGFAALGALVLAGCGGSDNAGPSGPDGGPSADSAASDSSVMDTGADASAPAIDGGGGDVGAAMDSGGGDSSVPDAGADAGCRSTGACREWTWVNGANVTDQSGVYGTQGSAAPTNVPGTRYSAVSWTDPGGNFWLFGGYGYPAAPSADYLNDLWEYASGQWTWVNGSKDFEQSGVYGIQGTPAATNFPGGRESAVSWTDAAGDLWLFGGYGFDSAGTGGQLSDLWRYASGEWTWMSGPKIANQLGVYGTRGTPAPGNTPGARQYAVSWTDAAGSLWLFGGTGFDADQNGGDNTLNDLWKYAAGEWTWVSGSNGVDQSGFGGVYGVKGSAAPTNAPGARGSAVACTDAAGTVWLFGGSGLDSAGGDGQLNDLWKYAAGEWTWVSGSNVINQDGVYGVQGSTAPTNVPGARSSAVLWSDGAGSLWLFGGTSVDASGAPHGLNDLWRYRSGEWTWVSGSDMVDQSGVYGTEGTAAATNTPGARASAVSWTDAAGNLWLFGGDLQGASYDDLWEY